MLNRVVLMGRITHDLEMKQTQSGMSVLRFSIAVDRGYVKQGEERQTDFITCVAWRQTAEFIGKYFSKGRMIALEGQLRTGSYDDKNGVKHYTADVNVDNVSFTGEPKQQGADSYPNNHSNGSYQQNNNNTAAAADALSIGDISDFEDILSDDGTPF